MLQSGAILITGTEWATRSGRLGQGQAARAAAQAFREARFQAGLTRLVARITGRSSDLRALGAAAPEAEARGGHYDGLRPVPLSLIVGSEGRSADFDRYFRPSRSHNRERWIRVACARLQGVALPAVDLIQVGDRYYVRDGNHRVSVARAFGQESIDAEVTVWEAGATPAPARA
ncbi:MAG TPA: hypothetical protein PKO09_06635 [Anaerolineae bacterium]|nr:hypothetical protein [Anaerolineae bacterium]